LDRIIEVKINGNYLTKDNGLAGVQHEANVTALRIEFDEGWDGYAKKVTWWNAKGENPVERTLTADLLEDITNSTRIYICYIPGEALTEAGECTFVVDGYISGKRQRSVSDKLKVKPAPFIAQAGQPADPTPTQAEQLQQQMESMLPPIQEQAVIAANAAAAAAESANTAGTKASEAAQSAASAANSASVASTSAAEAKTNATSAAQSASTANSASFEAQQAQAKAEAAVGKVCHIGANGNWYEWDAEKNAFVDTGVPARGPKGETGATGAAGRDGKDGDDYVITDADMNEIAAIAAKTVAYVQPNEPANAPDNCLWIDTDDEIAYVPRAEGVGF
jgi:hypothetical protein